MTDENNPATGRRSEGIAGPSREVSKRDENVLGAVGAGQENEELAWAMRHVPDDPVVRPVPQWVERKTELLGCGVRVKRKKQIPPTAEEILRTHIRTIMERQDRIHEIVFLNLNNFRLRIEEMEDAIAELRERGRS